MESTDSLLVKIWDDLPRYLRDGIALMKSPNDKEIVYRLTIVKKDWDKHPDSVIVRYAKDWKLAYGKNKPILETQGATLFEALMNMKRAVDYFKNEGLIMNECFYIKSYQEIEQFKCGAGIPKENSHHNRI